MRGDLLGVAADGVRQALHLGADEAEVMATAVSVDAVEIKQGDLQHATCGSETTFGIRVLSRGGLGFATVNTVAGLPRAILDALAVAHAAVPDAAQGFADPASPSSIESRIDEALLHMDHRGLAEEAAHLLAFVRDQDSRVRVESGEVEITRMCRAVANSRGVRAEDSNARASASLMAMAVDGSEVGSFDHDAHEVTSWSALRNEACAMAQRIITKSVGALHPEPGVSFQGPVILAPEVVLGFLLGNLLSMMEGRALRTGRSPLQKSLGTRIGDARLHIEDDPTDSSNPGYATFDREGVPTRKSVLVENGVMMGALRDVYESRAAAVQPQGHARGGAASLPTAGPAVLSLRPGTEEFAEICGARQRAVLVTRFSGNCNPTSGEFSGVVKGGFLLTEGSRRPIKETLISGNLYEALHSIWAVSREVRMIGGRHRIPALAIDGISITAG